MVLTRTIKVEPKYCECGCKSSNYEAARRFMGYSYHQRFEGPPGDPYSKSSFQVVKGPCGIGVPLGARVATREEADALVAAALVKEGWTEVAEEKPLDFSILDSGVG